MKLKEYYNLGDDGAMAVYGVNWYAQIWTTTSAYNIQRIKLKLYKTGNPGTVTVSIRETMGEVPVRPTDVDIDGVTAVYNGNNITEVNEGEWIEFNLSSSIALSSGTKYAIVIQASSGSVGNIIYIKSDVSSPEYYDGHIWKSTNSGMTWTVYIGSADTMFECWGSVVEEEIGRLLDSFNSGDTGSSSPIKGNDWIAQIFTTSYNHVIKAVRLKLFRNLSPGNIIVSIKTAGSPPSGEDLASGSINGNTITDDSGGEWYTVSFESSAFLQKGGEYAIVVRAPDASGDNYVKWRESVSGNRYLAGKKAHSNDGGDSWSEDDAEDMMFESYGFTEKSTLSYGPRIIDKLTVGGDIIRVIKFHPDNQRIVDDNRVVHLESDKLVND